MTARTPHKTFREWSTEFLSLARYGHLFPELDEAIAAAFGERFVEVSTSRSSNVVSASFAG